MRTHVLRAHVTRHGGKLVTAGEGADFLVCDKATADQNPLLLQELWGEGDKELLALDNRFISKSVVAQKRLGRGMCKCEECHCEDFVLKGTLPKNSRGSNTETTALQVVDALTPSICVPHTHNLETRNLPCRAVAANSGATRV